MNIKLLLGVCCMAIVFASCSHVYEPALYHEDIAYMPKPASFDTVKAANYISGGLNVYSNTHFNDVAVTGQLNLSRGYVFDNFNVAYGAFGVFGDYQSDQTNKAAPSYFSDKYFEAIGGRFSANAFVSSERTDFRFIGVEMAYSHEFGTYAAYRQYLNTLPGTFVDPRTDLFTIGLTTEVIFHNRNNSDIEHGFRGFLGTTLGHNELDDTFYANQTSTDRMFRNIFPKLTYFIKFKNFIGSIDGSTDFFIRFGYKF